MNKVVKEILGWVVYLVVLVLLIYGIPKGLAYALDTEHPMASISSDSMWPALKQGDLVFIKGIKDKEEIEMGDIVVYKNERGFTIHRVIRLNENSLITKGDANNKEDSPVKYEDVVGKAVTLKETTVRIPLLGNIGLLVQGYK